MLRGIRLTAKTVAPEERKRRFAELALQIATITGHHISVATLPAPKRCDGCTHECDVFVEPADLCAQCWSHSVFRF